MEDRTVIAFPRARHRGPGEQAQEIADRRIGGADAVKSFRERWNLMSLREKEVAKLYVFHDLDLKEIAAELDITTRTVKYHMAIILRLLSCRNGRRLALAMGLHIRAIVPEYKEEA